VAVKLGQSVRRGDTLMTLEAMKMELSIKSEVDGTVRVIHVASGTSISAKELLLEMSL
jgi:pyruvate carboxylase